MKKFLPILFILNTLYLILYTPVRADFDKAYQDYLYQYDQYRTALTTFLTAKNTFLTYQTLISQTDALLATKTFLEARDQVLVTYLTMLTERNPQQAYRDLLSQEIKFFSDHQSLIPAIGSLEDATKVSGTASEHFPITQILAKQTVIGVLLNKVLAFDNRLNSLEAGYENEINLVKGQGKDVATLERWLLETKNKELLAKGKMDSALSLAVILKPKSDTNSSAEDYSAIQVQIFEANQYLKEAVSYLNEIKEELKYGNY